MVTVSDTSTRIVPSGRRHSPPSLSMRSAPHTPGNPSRLRFQALHRFRGLHPGFGGSALPAPALADRTSNDAAGFASCYGPHRCSPYYRAFDAGLRPRPFPGEAASLLPGLLAATRTGLTPASNDELTNTKINRGLTSRSHLPLCWAHERLRLTGSAQATTLRPSALTYRAQRQAQTAQLSQAPRNQLDKPDGQEEYPEYEISHRDTDNRSGGGDAPGLRRYRVPLSVPEARDNPRRQA